MKTPTIEEQVEEKILKALATLDIVGQVTISVDLQDGEGEKDYDLKEVLTVRLKQEMTPLILTAEKRGYDKCTVDQEVDRKEVVRVERARIWSEIQKLTKITLTTDDKEMGEFLNAVDLDDLEAITNLNKENHLPDRPINNERE